MQLIDFKKYENSVKKKKVNKKKIIIITLISILILLVIIMSLIYVYNKQFRDIVDTYIFRKNIQENNGTIIEVPADIDTNNIIAYNKYVGILDKSILNIYSSNGRKDKEIEVQISNCIYDTENRLLICTSNSLSFRPFDE